MLLSECWYFSRKDRPRRRSRPSMPCWQHSHGRCSVLIAFFEGSFESEIDRFGLMQTPTRSTYLKGCRYRCLLMWPSFSRSRAIQILGSQPIATLEHEGRYSSRILIESLRRPLKVRSSPIPGRTRQRPRIESSPLLAPDLNSAPYILNIFITFR